MQVQVFANSAQVAAAAGAFFARQIQRHPRSVLGLATGSSPIGLYADLVARHRAGGLPVDGLTTFNLDEYVGLTPEHPQSYRYFMQQHLFGPLGLKPDQVHLPSGDCADLAAQCAAYDQAIERSGGIDLQLLGLGRNGHVGFNEPGTPFGTRTHIVRLAEDTIHANARFFDSVADVPTQAISMGIRSIMNARRILLVAMGPEKAEALRGTIHGPVSEQLPASVLQLHPDVTLMLDEQAASLL